MILIRKKKTKKKEDKILKLKLPIFQNNNIPKKFHLLLIRIYKKSHKEVKNKEYVKR